MFGQQQRCQCDDDDCIEDCDDVIPNPKVNPMCPLKVTLIMDESGSIVGVGGASNIAHSAKSCCTRFSPVFGERVVVQVSIVEFNSRARLAVQFQIHVTAASVAPGGTFYNYLYADNNTTGSGDRIDS